MNIIDVVKARIEARENEATVEGEVESLVFWIHCFYYHLGSEGDTAYNRAERWGFRFSIEDHAKTLQKAISNKRWFATPNLNKLANKE